MTSKTTRVVLALDCESLDKAKSLIEVTGGLVDLFKIGPILFTASGPQAVEVVRERGKDVFLDLKFHDIPNTVKGAVRSACSLGVRMLTLHVSGGQEMLEAARAGAEEGSRRYESPKPLLIGVTRLTSMQVTEDLDREVARLARVAFEAGLDGVVCSAREVETIKKACGGKLVTVVPGIRLKQDRADDQARVASPGEAARAGADFIVVGRSVIRADDPLEKLRLIAEEIKNA